MVVETVAPAKTAAAVVQSIKQLISKGGYNGIVVAVNRPYTVMKETLAKEGVDVKKLFFIDLVTRTPDGRPQAYADCICVTSSQNLTEISIAISQALSVLPKGKRFLLLDSVNTLMTYNNPAIVLKFFHFVITKLREAGVNGIFVVSDDKADHALMVQLSSFVDKVVEV